MLQIPPHWAIFLNSDSEDKMRGYDAMSILMYLNICSASRVKHDAVWEDSTCLAGRAKGRKAERPSERPSIEIATTNSLSI